MWCFLRFIVSCGWKINRNALNGDLLMYYWLPLIIVFNAVWRLCFYTIDNECDYYNTDPSFWWIRQWTLSSLVFYWDHRPMILSFLTDATPKSAIITFLLLTFFLCTSVAGQYWKLLLYCQLKLKRNSVLNHNASSKVAVNLTLHSWREAGALCATISLPLTESPSISSFYVSFPACTNACVWHFVHYPFRFSPFPSCLCVISGLNCPVITPTFLLFQTQVIKLSRMMLGYTHAATDKRI